MTAKKPEHPWITDTHHLYDPEEGKEAVRAIDRWNRLPYDERAARPLLTLRTGMCRWPVRDRANGRAALFCGRPVEHEKSVYCYDHHQLSLPKQLRDP
jgi:hypothetical protein